MIWPMIRCPGCGMRLRQRQPSCPVHGAVPAAQAVVHTGPANESAGLEGLDLRAPALFASRGYRIGRVLGRGGFGVVFAATRASDGREVAIKIARSERGDAAESLLRECAALEAVGAP